MAGQHSESLAADVQERKRLLGQIQAEQNSQWTLAPRTLFFRFFSDPHEIGNGTTIGGRHKRMACSRIQLFSVSLLGQRPARFLRIAVRWHMELACPVGQVLFPRLECFLNCIIVDPGQGSEGCGFGFWQRLV